MMNTNKPHTSTTRSLTPARSSMPTPWRRTAILASLALGLAGLAPTAHASLQVYEGFDYTVGQSLNAQSGGTGMTGSWTAANTGGDPYTTPSGFGICDSTSRTWWNGALTSLPPGSGKYTGSPAGAAAVPQVYNGNNPDHLWAWRSLDPSVKANFTLGSTTWMSFVEANDFINNANGTGGVMGIGSRYFSNDTRGDSMNGGSGTSIGIGQNPLGSAYTRSFAATSWSPGMTYGTGTGPTWANTDKRAWICIAKIVWGNASNPTTITVDAYPDGTVLSEATFNASSTLTTLSVTVDPTTFDYITLGGGRCNYDELRIGTTFNDAIGVVVASTGNYWAPGLTGGGTGTWEAGSNVWSTSPGTQGTSGQASTGTLVFSGVAGTVTVNGSVSAVAGLQFLATGYDIVAGTSSPDLSLTGAAAADNTISVNSGETATIGVTLSGTAGLTKAGDGTLVLSGTGNTYGGATVLNAGTLQIAALGSLGSNVTFGGGTLQYPPGSGASALDVSGKLSAIASPQVVMIDTNGNDVIFGTAITGNGGLTKLGAGSLTLNAAAPTGVTTVSAGTLDVSSASGTIGTLTVPTGGTLNLGAGATITTLNVTGGTVHITGAGVSVGTLVANAGMLEAATNSLAVTTQATVAGVLLSGTAITLSGANVIAPDSGNHRVVAAASGSLNFAATGFDAAIGISQPGTPALPATATFSGGGVWALHGGAALDNNNFYGQDNHAFHYIQVPAGDFSIVVHVTGATNASAGLMARDSLSAKTGNSAGIWTGMSATCINGVLTSPGVSTPGNPWLMVTKAGNVVTTYYSSDGTNYTKALQQDYSSNPWGATTYVGLDLANTSGAVGTAVGTYDNVNFMGTASLPHLSDTELNLSGGALANVGCKVNLGKLTINTVVQPDGAYNATNTPGSVSGSGAIIIGDNSTTVTLGNLSQVYDGSGKTATHTVTPSGLTVNVTYNGSATAPINAGSYITSAVVADPYYSGLTTGTLVIAPAPVTVTLSNLNQHFDGNPKPVTVTTTPPGVGVTVTYNGLATPVPSAVGSYPVVATVSNANYTGTESGTLVITAATDFDTWAASYLPKDVSNPAADYDGDGMTNFQEYAFGLNPTSGASCNPIVQPLDPATGVFKYTRRASPSTTGIAYTVMTSSNLVSWLPDPVSVPESVTTSGNVETVTFTLSNGPIFGKLFVRVEATQQ